MPQINVVFQNQKILELGLEENTTTRSYLQLLDKNLKRGLPMWRDPLKYNLEYFKKLCLEIKDKLKWEWDMDSFTQDKMVVFHKDIEKFLDKEQSFRKIPGEYQNLIHEAHYCIHTIQYREGLPNPHLTPRGIFLQLEWFNDDYMTLPEDFEFKLVPNYGDILLQNPYVGHPPLQCYKDDDYKNISRTCAFHDKIKPGINIHLDRSGPLDEIDMEKYKKWWMEKCRDFVEKEGMDKIIRYTGIPVIGKVKDLKLLENIVNTEYLKIESIEIV